MKVTRIYADELGKSHFDEVEIQSLGTLLGELRVSVSVSQLIFRETEGRHAQGWHCAPQRQFVVLLDGRAEVEVSSGEKRVFGAGDTILVEDTQGEGHKTTVLTKGRRRSLFIPLN